LRVNDVISVASLPRRPYNHPFRRKYATIPLVTTPITAHTAA
jgi:hypothetical protein